MDIRPSREGSVAAFRAALSDALDTVNAGGVRSMAIVIATDAGQVYVRIEVEPGDDLARLAIKGALL